MSGCPPALPKARKCRGSTRPTPRRWAWMPPPPRTSPKRRRPSSAATRASGRKLQRKMQGVKGYPVKTSFTLAVGRSAVQELERPTGAPRAGRRGWHRQQRHQRLQQPGGSCRRRGRQARGPVPQEEGRRRTCRATGARYNTCCGSAWRRGLDDRLIAVGFGVNESAPVPMCSRCQRISRDRKRKTQLRHGSRATGLAKVLRLKSRTVGCQLRVVKIPLVWRLH